MRGLVFLTNYVFTTAAGLFDHRESKQRHKEIYDLLMISENDAKSSLNENSNEQKKKNSKTGNADFKDSKEQHKGISLQLLSSVRLRIFIDKFSNYDD